MSNNSTYKERLIRFFENKKILVWIFFLLLGIVFAGKIVSSLDSFGINNSRENKRCEQIDQSISELDEDIKEVFRLSNNSINILKIKYSLSQHKALILEAEDEKCFMKTWKEEELSTLKTILLSEIYLFIKDGEEKIANPSVEKELSLLCKEIIEYFDVFGDKILSEKEKNVLLKTIKITQDEN